MLRRYIPLSCLLLLCCAAGPSRAGSLSQELGRAETRVFSAPTELFGGRTVVQLGLADRLARLGYRRVHERPTRVGEFFWGRETFWIYRKPFRWAGKDRAAALFGLVQRSSDGRVVGWVDAREEARSPELSGWPWLEPELLAEDLEGRRARRVSIEFADLPEHVWQPLLAAEDARFFDHMGLDARGVARALLANMRAGKVKQGGSTLTQQLIKMRDLSPKRTLGRKASEAVRALTLEASHDKADILEAYLNHVYLGHRNGLAIHGYGAAARVYFSKEAEDLDVTEASLLAALVQGPNRLAPTRHPERALTRRNWVLGRLGDLGWLPPKDVASGRSRSLGLKLSDPEPPMASHFLSWAAEVAEREAGGRLEKGRGVVVETSLDPWLQAKAEGAVESHLRRLRRDYRRLSGAGLTAALVALDARTGAVLAHVGGDPAAGGEFDRARSGQRQPGSTVKPLILLEAFAACGDRTALSPSSRVADEALTISLPSGDWEPRNSDDEFRGTVSVRRALRESLNVPFVRLCRWCGAENTAQRLREAGLVLPQAPPPSFALGAVETSPLLLSQAYSTFGNLGSAVTARPVVRLERPQGRSIWKSKTKRHAVADSASTWLVRELLREAATEGTASGVALPGLDIAAKTGTSSSRRDAWLAGEVSGMVVVVWVGRDDGTSTGLTGASGAAPLWKDFVAVAALSRPARSPSVPRGIVRDYVDPVTGLRVSERHRRAKREVFRRGALPPRARFWRRDEPVPIVR